MIDDFLCRVLDFFSFCILKHIHSSYYGVGRFGFCTLISVMLDSTVFHNKVGRSGLVL